MLSAAPAFADPNLKSTGPVEFGAVDLHFGGSPREQLQIENVSEAEVQLDQATIEGSQSFSIVQDYCSNQALQPTMSCTVEIEFQTQSAGAKSGQLKISGGEEEALEVPLTGEAVTGTLAPASASPVQFSPLPYAQPEREGEGNETEQVNVLDSVAGTQVSAVGITGPDAASFSISYGNCEDNAIAAGNTCDEGVRFEPRTPGLKHAVLVLESDASSGLLEIPLEGVALNGAQLSIDTSQALLGEVLLGGSAQHIFTLTNTGDYPLYMERAFLVSGTPLMFPKLADSCSGHALQPGSSCSMTIGFQPTATGEKSAGMILITNATPSIQVIGIDGIGVPAAAIGPVPAPSITTPEPTVAPNEVTGPALTSVRTPEIDVGATVRSGLVARCPLTPGGCQVVSRVTTAGRMHGPNGDLVAGTVVLGSGRMQLAEGTTRRVRIHLTQSATALLNRRLKTHGRLRVTITTEVRAGTTILATRSRTLVLLGTTSS